MDKLLTQRNRKAPQASGGTHPRTPCDFRVIPLVKGLHRCGGRDEGGDDVRAP